MKREKKSWSLVLGDIVQCNGYRNDVCCLLRQKHFQRWHFGVIYFVAINWLIFLIWDPSNFSLSHATNGMNLYWKATFVSTINCNNDRAKRQKNAEKTAETLFSIAYEWVSARAWALERWAKIKRFALAVSSDPTYFDGYQNHLLSLVFCFPFALFLFIVDFFLALFLRMQTARNEPTHHCELSRVRVWETKTKYTKTN